MSKNSDRESPNNEKIAFVISPIGAPGTDVYKKSHYALKYIYKEALEPEGWAVHRADDGESPDSINHHVVKSVHEADLIIADLTGHNPNVFYELAIAHGFKKPVVHLISAGENMPFDIVDQRTIFYDITDLESVERTKATLVRYADYAVDNSDKLVTPLTSYENFSRIDSSLSDTQKGDAIVVALEEISSRLSRLERQTLYSPSAYRGLINDKDTHNSKVDSRRMTLAVEDPTYPEPVVISNRKLPLRMSYDSKQKKSKLEKDDKHL